MKHDNESISRLDGDIYETCTGQYIDMRSIISVGGVDEDVDSYGAAFPVHCRLLEKPIYIWYDFIQTNFRTSGRVTISNIDREETTKMAEKRRLEFIEVWKHWKSKQ